MAMPSRPPRPPTPKRNSGNPLSQPGRVPVVVDDVPFVSRRQAAAYLMQTYHVSFRTAMKNLAKGIRDFRVHEFGQGLPTGVFMWIHDTLGNRKRIRLEEFPRYQRLGWVSGVERNRDTDGHFLNDEDGPIVFVLDRGEDPGEVW